MDKSKNLQNCSSSPIRVLVVDDTIVYRKSISDALSQIPDVEVIGSAPNGKIAVNKILSLSPDIITLDIEMPEMNGLEVLEWMSKESPGIGAIVLSNFTTKGGEMTIKALELGAFDFIPKPQGGSLSQNRDTLKDSLSSILTAYKRSAEIRRILGKNTTPTKNQSFRKSNHSLNSVKRSFAPQTRKFRSEIVAIGISTGGPKALAEMLPQLPPDIGVPILIVQHMPPLFTTSLAKNLDSKSRITVKEAIDGETIHPNIAYIAPGGKQMRLSSNENGLNKIIQITDDPPENSCKPSADYLFKSVAQYYSGKATGVIMTGMGHDGTLGLKILKDSGAAIIAQDQQTCVVFGMPRGPIENGIVDIISPLQDMAMEIYRTVNPEIILLRDKESIL